MTGEVDRLEKELEQARTGFKEAQRLLDGEMRQHGLTQSKVQNLREVLKLVRTALPVLQCMTGKIGLDIGEAKSIEMMEAIDAALADTEGNTR